MRLACVLPIALLSIAATAHAAGAQAALAPLRSHIEASDYRGTGQLVRVDANGDRISYQISVQGLWFDGALHTLVEIVPPKDAAQARQDGRLRILLEMRPDGRDTIKVFRPHEPTPALLIFDKWDQGLRGSAFSYEDFFEPEYFWPGQTILRSATFGAHLCDVLKSTPGPSDRTHYSEVQTWLDRTIDYPVYAEKTIKQGGMVKEFTYYGLHRFGGVWTATQVEVKMRGQAGSTLLIIKRGSAKAHLSPRDFSSGQIGHFEDRR